MARAVDPLRARALQAFDEFFVRPQELADCFPVQADAPSFFVAPHSRGDAAAVAVEQDTPDKGILTNEIPTASLLDEIETAGEPTSE